jgi:hypothetical protein
MNNIEIVRNEIKEFFNADSQIIENEIIFSPSGKYRVETNSYKQNKPDRNWEVTKVEIFNESQQKIIFSFFVNEGTFYYSWVTKGQIEYLLCAEDLCGGQTVIDLTNQKLSSYSLNNDGLIWTKHLLSPDEKLLAVFGCGWGSAFFVTVYHFDKPMELPLQIAYEPSWTGYDIEAWIDNKSLKVKKTEDEFEVLEL